ncbi:MAG: acyltransferase family protein [Acutalibacteraceae bacterium]
MEMKTRKNYIDMLNIIACFAVVCLHCSGAVFNFSVSKLWFCSITIQSIFHWAVPIFFMISGATLLNYRDKYTTKEFFKRRALKVFIPFIFWTIFYAFNKNNFRLVGGIKYWLEVFLNNRASNILWFLYSIMSIYLCIPILSLITKEENKNIVLYYIILCFTNVSLIPLFVKLTNVEVTQMLIPPITFEYTGYVLLGWYLSRFELSQKSRYRFYFLGVISVFMMIFGTFYLSKDSYQLDLFVMRYFSFSCLFMSIAVFVFAKYSSFIELCFLKNKTKNIIRTMSSLSFGIYLIHILTIEYLPLVFKMVNVNSGWFMIYGPFLIYFVTALIVFIIKKIPILNKIIP